MIEYYLTGASVRGTQVLVDAAIWIAVGCLVAAIFRNWGPEQTRSVFGDQTRFGLLIGWLLGMLLPVCSLGVIPVVRELHRAGVKGGTIIAFGLTAPLFNPMSVLYGLTLSDPIAILSFSFCALLIVSCLGFLWDRFFPPSTQPPETGDLPAPGIKRSIAILLTTGRELVGWSLPFILIGIFGSVTLSVVLSKGALQAEAEPDKFYAPILMAMVATPVYATPLQAMAQIGGMFQHGNSIGAAFSLLILGAGANLGLLALFGFCFGTKRILAFVFMLVTATLALAYLVDKPLYPEGASPSGHTHAFDVYTHPYYPEQTDLWAKASEDIQEYRNGNDFGNTQLLAAVAVLGILGWLLDRVFGLEQWLLHSVGDKPKYDRYLSGGFIATVVIAGLVGLSIFGAYLFYLPPNELLKDLDVLTAECVTSTTSENWEAVERLVPLCDDMSRRLEIGVLLRAGDVSEMQVDSAKVYRDRLDELRDAIEDGEYSNTRTMAMDMYDSYQIMKKMFKTPDGE